MDQDGRSRNPNCKGAWLVDEPAGHPSKRRPKTSFVSEYVHTLPNRAARRAVCSQNRPENFGSYVNPGGPGDIRQQGGNQLTKTHQSDELEKYYFEDRTNSYVIVDPARDADPNPRSYGVRVIVHCRSEVFAEEIEEEGLDVVHIITVSKCEKKNYAPSQTKKKSARPAKKPRASSRGRRSPAAEPLSPATVGAPPSPPSPGAKIDAALASPEAPPPAPPSSPDEPDDEPEDPMLALEYTGP